MGRERKPGVHAMANTVPSMTGCTPLLMLLGEVTYRGATQGVCGATSVGSDFLLLTLLGPGSEISLLGSAMVNEVTRAMLSLGKPPRTEHGSANVTSLMQEKSPITKRVWRDIILRGQNGGGGYAQKHLMTLRQGLVGCQSGEFDTLLRDVIAPRTSSLSPSSHHYHHENDRQQLRTVVWMVWPACPRTEPDQYRLGPKPCQHAGIATLLISPQQASRVSQNQLVVRSHSNGVSPGSASNLPTGMESCSPQQRRGATLPQFHPQWERAGGGELVNTSVVEALVPHDHRGAEAEATDAPQGYGSAGNDTLEQQFLTNGTSDGPPTAVSNPLTGHTTCTEHTVSMVALCLLLRILWILVTSLVCNHIAHVQNRLGSLTKPRPTPDPVATIPVDSGACPESALEPD